MATARDRDLVLMTRLTVLKNSFEQVGGIVRSVQEGRQHVSNLCELLAGDEESILAAAVELGYQIDVSMANLRALRASVGETNTRRIDAGMAALESAKEEIANLQRRLEEATTAINKIQIRTVEVDEEKDLGKTLTEELQKKAEGIAASFRALQRELDKAKSSPAPGNDNNAALLIEKAWQTYKETLSESSQQLLAEYVDFLAGLALRDAGLDQGICQLADELVRRWESALSVNWESLTIPSYREAESMTPARIIRLGFPEWTIWALPLTAHEFGHVVVASSAPLASLIPSKGAPPRVRRHRQELAADAVATYAMGPAYACAAILLRFNPLGAYSPQGDQPAVAGRAAIILAILERMNKDPSPYEEIIELLRDEWAAAITQAQPDMAPETLARAQAELAEWLATETASWLDRFWDYLDQNTLPIYSGETWDATRKWTDWLLRGDIENIPLGDSGLLDVLNAAWLSRVKHPAQTDVIERSALALWEKIQKRDAGVRGATSSRSTAGAPVRQREGHR